MSIKKEVLKLISDLPEDTTLEEIMYKLYVKVKIEEGIRQLDEGKGISHKDAMEKISEWLN